MILNFREYTALYYLSNGNIDAFDELLLRDISEKDYYTKSIKQLMNLNLIDKTGNKIYITSKGLEIVKNKNKQKEEFTSRKWIDEFRKQFPPLKMGDKDDVIEEMDNFVNKYEFTKEEIIKGTEEYMKSHAETNYKYVTSSIKFIKGECKTNLKTLCEYIRLKKEIDVPIYNGKIME